MGRNKIPVFLLVIVTLAVIGLVSSLVNNPGQLLIRILIGAGIAYVVFLIFTRVLNNRGNTETSDEMKKYKKAAKMSNQKYQGNHPPSTNKVVQSQPKKRKRRRATHLRVIEGNKDNKKEDDQASN